MSHLLMFLDIVICIMAFFVLVGSLYLYLIVQNEPFAHIKSRLFHRFKEVRTCLALALTSLFFLWWSVTIDLFSDSDLPFFFEVIGRLSLLCFELMVMSLIPIARILEGNKRRRLSFYYHTLERLRAPQKK